LPKLKEVFIGSVTCLWDEICFDNVPELEIFSCENWKNARLELHECNNLKKVSFGSVEGKAVIIFPEWVESMHLGYIGSDVTLDFVELLNLKELTYKKENVNNPAIVRKFEELESEINARKDLPVGEIAPSKSSDKPKPSILRICDSPEITSLSLGDF